jgi:hypothetical protein
MATADVSTQQPRRIGRSIAAVFAGLLTIAVLDNLIDFILHSTGVYPPVGQTMADGLFLLAVGYRTIDGILGCYLAAALAPSRPMRHALTLGGIGVVLSTLGLLATLGGGPELGPIWYPLTLVAITPVCAYIGGRLVAARRPPAPAAIPA